MVDMTAAEWNAQYPVGTPVTAYPGTREGDRVLATATRSRAWTVGYTTAVVSVNGWSGGIALTHVDVRGTVQDELDRIIEELNRAYVIPGYQLVWQGATVKGETDGSR